jgi:hypothetical protein
VTIAEATTFIDVEGAIREWAREAVPSVQRRVFFFANDNIDTAQIVLQRIGGPDDDCLIQFDVWAAKKGAAATLAAELATAADGLRRYIHGDVVLHGAAVEQIRWLPDQDAATPEERVAPRYIVEVTFTATSTGLEP